MLKKILTYFGMLIVPHALHCVDGCIFEFTSFDTVCCFGFYLVPSPPPPPQKKNDYMIMPENFNKNLEQKRGPASPPPPPPPKKKKKKQIWILCQNSLTRELKIRVVGFVLKKLLTYFEMLIVPHALQCIDGCFFVFYRI